ncbi:uncharacterized protein LOC110713094 [Chenopodium quinoa]|uniref:uncharacterized protein LOC110713094 n=1 Tax=Chenopodium quinoa TaxID=63459 RepID=UPI000B795FF6|nr:uncharacterized protein LOC110713094 [Chenopodium quinoa]
MYINVSFRVCNYLHILATDGHNNSNIKPGEGSRSFREWCNIWMEKIKEPKRWDMFWFLAWGIWLKRKGWVFEGKGKDDAVIIHKVAGLIGEYEDALERAVNVNPIQHLGSIWKSPEVGWYKLNLDAAVFGLQQLGIGGGGYCVTIVEM